MGSTDFPTLTAPGQQPKITDITKDFSMEALGQLVQHIGLNVQIPIERVLGFDKFTPEVAAQVSTAESTTSSSYTDLATVGPQLSNLADGQYLLLYVVTFVVGGSAGRMSVKINSTEATDADSVEHQLGQYMSLMGYTFKTMTNGGSNTVTCRYKNDGSFSSTFKNRRLAAIKYANP